MHVVTSVEMRKLDQYTIETIGIPSIVLMENAGREVANEIIFWSEQQKHRAKKWLILVGKGNNGGDGLVAARHLIEAGFDIKIIYAQSSDTFKGDMIIQYKITKNINLSSSVYQKDTISWTEYDGIIDALLGTGTKGTPKEPYSSLIDEANASGLPIFSIDIPSGLDADTGMIYQPCIQAHQTITLAFLKCGLVQSPGAEASGNVIVKPIGIPISSAENYPIHTYVLQPSVFTKKLNVDINLPRNVNTHKGTYGHVLVIAGTIQMSGAGLLCSKAALRSGSGLVTWILPKTVAKHMLGVLPEAMLFPIEDKNSGQWSLPSTENIINVSKNKESIVIGPGLGRFKDDELWLQKIWEGVNSPVVLDADALNIISDAEHFKDWHRNKIPIIITPHPGEMARLMNCTTNEIQENRIQKARAYAVKHQLIVVLKGAHTIIALPNGSIYINNTGNAGMATGGAGDVLAGMIAGLLAQGFSAEQAAALGVYHHGLAGDRAAAKRNSQNSLIAGDIIEEL
ncbi:NAD(P)H-hydrate dehydratase [Chengkuizengella axinellae]|uniref:Bifunctional NAD(P)H-hydrate repair enzyme n=1 Tax=Chengkuizengella axinellae TaxID=3064388 RepID=A0ABT9J413_9BACL|nr:NAD(P)H-hydrate dehydratase [Chengkuizengella sp. 2205SS18-9]MDP5276376.1 NAD(P)H-hydrate dehydratase [Chengkuizengella sp. 2205SS18-9]